MAAHLSILAWRIHGQRSLAGYCLWSHKELDTTEHVCMCAHPHTHTHTHTHEETADPDNTPAHSADRMPPPSVLQFVCASSGFCKWGTTSSAYSDSFASFLPQVESFFFSCLIAMTRTSSGVLNTDGESGRPYLVPEL